MPAFADARAFQTNGPVQTDLLILGGGPAGISLALALAGSPFRVMLVESGGMEFDSATQSLYGGTQDGVPYLDLEGSRLRYLGGGTNHWGGWTRPLDALDFEKRDWIPHSGWPIPYSELTRYIPRAQDMIEAGPAVFDTDKAKWEKRGDALRLASGGVYTSWFQYSKTKDSPLPTRFGERYAKTLKRIPNLTVMLHANATALKLSPDARSLQHVEVTTLTGKHFPIQARHVVLAMGGIENTRLMLASNDVAKTGVGNGNDLVGRFFADHPIPDETATLVLFNGEIAPFYRSTQSAEDGTRYRAAFRPTEKFLRDRKGHNSLTTVENEVSLDGAIRALVETTASTLGGSGSSAKAWSLTCGLEPMPDPERRLTLTGEKDALGLPRLKLHNTIPDSSFAAYRMTLTEFGRQLLAAKIGMIRLNHNARDEWLSVLNWANHHMGTLRMGVNDKTGVVDTNSKVFDVENLFVAGSAVFPNYGASNPTMNLVALTLRLADHLKGLFK